MRPDENTVLSDDNYYAEISPLFDCISIPKYSYPELDVMEIISPQEPERPLPVSSPIG